MYYELTNTPDSPVSLSDAKDFLKISSSITKDDAIVQNLINTAVAYGELYTNRDFSIKTWEGFFDNLEYEGEPYPFIQLNRSPLISVEGLTVSVSGVDGGYTDFVLKRSSGYSKLLFNSTAPSIDSTVAYSFKVSFTTGYATLPEGLKTAILEHISFLYENRGDVPSDMVDQIKSLYHQYRIIPLYGV